MNPQTLSTRWTYAAHGPSFHGKRHDEIRALCRHAGFSGIEAHAKLFTDFSDEEIEAEGHRYREAGLKIDTFHLPYTAEDDISALYESQRRLASKRMQLWLTHAARLGARAAIAHPSVSRADTRIDGFDHFLLALHRTLEEVLPLAESLNIVIALENLPPAAGGRFGGSPEHFQIFHDKFAHPNLGFCLDVGHALMALHDRADEFHDAMKPALHAFHLVDNAGDRDSHLAPGRGLVRWGQVASLMREIGFSHAALVEAPPFAFGPDYSADAWHGLHQETMQAMSRC